MTYEDLAKRTPFVLACINETMRMYPPVTAIIALVGYSIVTSWFTDSASYCLNTHIHNQTSCSGALSFFLLQKRDAGKNAMIGSIPIPEGAKVQFNIYAIHHDERWHPSPEEYRPERFFESSPDYEKYRPRHPYSFIPFGAGAHKCIGYKFALQEALLCIISMLKDYQFEIDTKKHSGELVLWSSLTLVPSEGIWLRVKPRDQG